MCYLCPTWYFAPLALANFIHTFVAKLPSLLTMCFWLVNKFCGNYWTKHGVVWDGHRVISFDYCVAIYVAMVAISHCWQLFSCKQVSAKTTRPMLLKFISEVQYDCDNCVDIFCLLLQTYCNFLNKTTSGVSILLKGITL